MNKLNKHLSKIFILCLSLGVLLFAGSCNSWMSNDDFMSKIESEVHDANASAIQVYVRYANSKMGTSEPSGYTTMKVDVAAELSAVTSDDYGFVKWAAFSTNDFPTSQQHSNLFYETAEKYEENFKPLELPESEVFFSNPTEPTTTVKIYKERNDVFIIPVVAKRPTIVTSVPTNGSSDVVRNTSIRILFSKEMDPASFADEFGNSNIVVTSGSAVLTEAAGDLSAKDITANLNISLGKTGKMLTIAPKSGYYFDNNSQITVNIYEEVCDTDGFELNGKISFSFTTGVKLDSLAPRIEELYASPAADFSEENRFEQYYYLLQGEDVPVFKEKIDAATNELQYFLDFDAKNWETDPSKPAKYKKPILKQRVTRYLNIYVRANDIAGSGGNVSIDSNTQSESSVAAIQVRSCLYVNADGESVTTSAAAFADDSTVSSDYYLKPIQIGYAPGLKDSNCKIQDTFENVMDDSVTGGTLFTYDLEGLPDGLIKIDVWAVDMVGNSGETEQYALDKYNNNYRSIFVVKDTTKPDAEANKNNVIPDLTAAVNTDWFNATTYDAIKIQPNTAGNANSLKDAGDSAALVCEHDKLKWIVKPTADTNWVKTISANDPAWKPVTEEYSGFTKPSSDGPVTLTYALMDDLGNISDAVAIQAFNYDATLPSFNNLSWTAETGSTPGIAKENELASQTLVIPLKEITAGLKTVELTVAKGGLANPAYGNSFEGTGLSVKAGETSLTKGTDYTVSGNILTFNTAQTGFDTNLTIKGIKISDETSADALEGNYAIQVKATDAANNSTTTTLTQNTSVSIDSTKPVIQKIFIPNIRKAVRFEDTGNEAEYWIDYTKLSSLTGYSNPITDLEVTFNESNSGALVFDFSNSTVKLTSGSELYKGNTKISATVNESTQTLTINNPSDAVRNDPSAGSVKVQIKNAQIQLDSNNDAKVDIKISDTATNLSNSFNSVTSSEGTTEIPGIGKFKYDKESISSSYYTLTDKETEADCEAAEAGYTNNEYINAKITLCTTTKASGVYSITIDGPAEFDSTTTIKNSSNQPLTFDISDDKKTATFYKEVGGVKTHMLFNNAASSGKDVNISNLKLTGGEGSKSITLKAGHLSGVVNSGITQSIVLDTTPPAWVGKGLYVSYSSEENAKKVYPHPDPDSKVKVYGMDFGTKNTNNNLILYFYDKSSYTTIVPDVSDDNIADTFYWKNASATSYVTGRVLSNSVYTGHLMVYAKDKAGNKSSIIDFYRQPVSSLRAGLDALEHNAELIPP
ncbi:MAG: Ig-like domain-containing protein, partial [Treponema sp.]|nr:Ig-like domain-containing protein [Treponema sp.]